VRCGNKNKNIIVCHSGNPLCVPYGDVQDHLSHGDALGSCTNVANRAASGPMSEEGVSSAEAVAVYPNPSAGSFITELLNFKAGKAMLRIVDITGRQVLQQSIVVSATKQKLTINLDQAKSGVYFLQIVSDDKVHTTKLVLQR
jgi:hypothetical protein